MSSSYRCYSVFDLSDLPRDLHLLGQGSIDAQSSRPPVKDDDVDLERRRESAEKQKSAKDLEKKKEKKKNLERQALEKHRVKSRQKGESEEDSPDEDDGNEGDDDSDDSVGMAARLDRILEDPPRADADTSRVGASKKSSGGARDGQQKEASPRRSRAESPPVSARGQSVSPPQPPPTSGVGHWVKTMATGPLTRGRAAVAASSQREGGRGSTSPGARHVGGVEPRPAPA